MNPPDRSNGPRSRRLLPAPIAVAWTTAAVTALLVAVAASALLTGHRGLVPAETRDWILALVLCPLGARIASHVPRHFCGWLLLAVGALGGLTVATSLSSGGLVGWARDWLWWPGYGLLLWGMLLFPTGALPSRRWRPVAALLITSTAVGTIALASLGARLPGSFLVSTQRVTPGWDTWAFVLATAGVAVAALASLAAPLVRIGRTQPAQRGPLVWATVGGLLFVVTLALDITGIAPSVWLGATLSLPAAITASVLWHGLYDIDLLIHRSLLNGLSAVTGIAVYAGSVGLVTYSVPHATAPIAAALTVVFAMPLRHALARFVDRRLYGATGRPRELLSDLAHQVGFAPTPDDVLDQVVRTVTAKLLLPYAAVILKAGPTTATEDADGPPPRTPPQGDYTYAKGDRRSWPVTSLPLIHRGEQFGEFLVQQRSPDEPWTRREQELLADLARQIGPSAMTVRLTRDLLTARDRLVRAREEERRRLRRELHDGIGPTLSGARMQLWATTTLTPDPELLSRLDVLDATLASAATEVRRVIEGLRPAALDHGLPRALEGIQQRHHEALTIGLAVEGLPDELPAAVEVAVYRIVDEALTNVVKHAHARAAEVRIDAVHNWLRLSVADDGVGPGPARPGGVGLESIQQRCVELGGSHQLSPGHPGTVLHVVLPLA